MTRNWSWIVLAVVAISLAGCPAAGPAAGSGSDGGGGQRQGGDSRIASPLGSPRSAISQHIALIKQGDLDGLRGCFTERLRDQLTPEMIEAAKEQFPTRVNLDEMVHEIVEETNDEGQQTAKVMMENGRTLTTFVLVNGNWLADTIWFQ